MHIQRPIELSSFHHSDKAAYFAACMSGVTHHDEHYVEVELPTFQEEYKSWKKQIDDFLQRIYFDNTDGHSLENSLFLPIITEFHPNANFNEKGMTKAKYHNMLPLTQTLFYHIKKQIGFVTSQLWNLLYHLTELTFLVDETVFELPINSQTIYTDLFLRKVKLSTPFSFVNGVSHVSRVVHSNYIHTQAQEMNKNFMIGMLMAQCMLLQDLHINQDQKEGHLNINNKEICALVQRKIINLGRYPISLKMLVLGLIQSDEHQRFDHRDMYELLKMHREDIVSMKDLPIKKQAVSDTFREKAIVIDKMLEGKKDRTEFSFMRKSFQLMGDGTYHMVEHQLGEHPTHKQHTTTHAVTHQQQTKTAQEGGYHGKFNKPSSHTWNSSHHQYSYHYEHKPEHHPQHIYHAQHKYKVQEHQRPHKGGIVHQINTHHQPQHHQQHQHHLQPIKKYGHHVQYSDKVHKQQSTQPSKQTQLDQMGELLHKVTKHIAINKQTEKHNINEPPTHQYESNVHHYSHVPQYVGHKYQPKQPISHHEQPAVYHQPIHLQTIHHQPAHLQTIHKEPAHHQTPTVQQYSITKNIPEQHQQAIKVEMSPITKLVEQLEDIRIESPSVNNQLNYPPIPVTLSTNQSSSPFQASIVDTLTDLLKKSIIYSNLENHTLSPKEEMLSNSFKTSQFIQRVSSKLQSGDDPIKLTPLEQLDLVKQMKATLQKYDNTVKKSQHEFPQQ